MHAEDPARSEFGGETGGVISIISKSGTSVCHGEAGACLNASGTNRDLALRCLG